MNRRTLLTALAAPLPALAAPTLSRDPARVAILTPQGLSFAAVGPGVTLTRDPAGAWLLAATAPQIAHVRVTVADDGAVSGGNILILYRNGIAMLEGEDYERTATGVRVTKQAHLADDQWSALVQK